MSRRGPSRLGPRDLLAAAGSGLRTRRLRAALSALGIAIGVAAMVAVLGISASSRADLLAQLDALGTNLLRVTPGETFLGDQAKLPKESRGMLRRVGPVQQVAATGSTGASVRRSDLIPEEETGGISVLAADPELLGTLGGELASGRFLNRASARYPAVVLGAKAAERLGIATAGRQVWLGDRWFTVVSVLRPVTLAPEIDRAALVGFPAAEALLAPTARRARSMSGPTPTRWRRCGRCCRPPPTRPTPTRSGSAAPRTRWPPGRPPTPPSPRCCSGWGRSPCWSAGWGSRT
jgi:hypothetical protein